MTMKLINNPFYANSLFSLLKIDKVVDIKLNIESVAYVYLRRSNNNCKDVTRITRKFYYVNETNLKSEHYVNFVKTFFLRSILRILCKHEI